jgi:hypothetical protein
VKPVRALKQQYGDGDRNLAVGRRGQPKKWTQGNGWSRKMLATTRRRMTCRSGVEWRKGHDHQGPGKDNVVLGTRNGRAFGKRRRAKPEGITGIRSQGSRQQLRLESKGNVN